MEIILQDEGLNKMISPHGEIDLYNAIELRDFVYDNIDKSVKSLVIDMLNVSYIDSSGIGVLLAIKRKMKDVNGTLALINLNDNIQKIFKLATLDKFFAI